VRSGSYAPQISGFRLTRAQILLPSREASLTLSPAFRNDGLVPVVEGIKE